MNPHVRIGIVDSGVNLAHPHIGYIAGGVAIGTDFHEPSYVDYLGHGTAVAALIHARAPQAELFAVKVFHSALVTSLSIILTAIDWCLQNEMDLINLSLGTTNGEHRVAFEAAVARARAAGRGIVSAFDMDGVPSLPGCLLGVVGVLADSSRSPGEHRTEIRGGKKIFSACTYPRDIPGVPRERNIHGASFAVAHVTATLAGLWPPCSSNPDWESILCRHLQQMATVSLGATPDVPSDDHPSTTY